MTEEEIQRENQLIDEYNRLLDYRNQLVDQHNALVQELNIVSNAAIVSIQMAQNLDTSFLSVLEYTREKVDEVNEQSKVVYEAIKDLEKKYFIVKNISTATKKLTELDNKFERKFRFYRDLRRITLGYVIGVDSNIISNESLRKTVEKKYLLNSEYWLAHCLMATMLWVSDEKEASKRALELSLQTKYYHSVLFYLLVNIRFGRQEAAKKWYRLYQEKIDVNDIGEEFQYLLQAYLYNAFGSDEEFKKEVSQRFEELLDQVKHFNASFHEKKTKNVKLFAESFAYNTDKEFDALRKYCGEYPALLELLTSAEKNRELALYYQEILDKNDGSPRKLTEKIEDVLYNLVNAYDEAEFDIIKQIRYNEYIVKARGDLLQAKKMYDMQFANEDKLSLDDLLFKIAFSDLKSNVDNKLRIFAIGFLIDEIKEGYKRYREAYLARQYEKYQLFIGGCKVVADPNNFDDAKKQIITFYSRNKIKFLFKDIWIKVLTALLAISFIAVVVVVVIAIVNKNLSTPNLIALIVSIVLTIIFALCFWRRCVYKNKDIDSKRREALAILNDVYNELGEWQKTFTQADEQFTLLQDVLEQFDEKKEIKDEHTANN